MQSQPAFWRLPRVEQETGYRRSTIYRLVKEKRFPAPVRIGDRASAWVDVEVRDWIAGRIEASRRAAA